MQNGVATWKNVSKYSEAAYYCAVEIVPPSRTSRYPKHKFREVQAT
jgi:hypothetical protein